MKDNLIRKYTIFVLGCLVMGLGIGICNHAGLGVDPMSVMVTGFLNTIGLTFGICNFIVSMIQILIGYPMEKKNVTLATFVAMVVVSFGIDAFSWFHFPASQGLMCYLVLALGIIVYGLGIALSQLPDCGLSAYDVLIFGMIKTLKKEYHLVRWICDITMLVIGIVMGGSVGIGTVMILLFAGKVIEIEVTLLKKANL